MGSFHIGKQELVRKLIYHVAHKAGVALTVANVNGRMPDLGRYDDNQGIRLESTEYEEYLHELMGGIGFAVPSNRDHIFPIAFMRDNPGSQAMVVEAMKLFAEQSRTHIDENVGVDRTQIADQLAMKHGKVAIEFIQGLAESSSRVRNFSPWLAGRIQEWADTVKLSDLDKRLDAKVGATFLDGRLFDYLRANAKEMGSIHWRNFELLTAEMLRKMGYKVDIGTGGNDDNIDIRAWDGDSNLTLVHVKGGAKSGQRAEQNKATRAA